MTCRGTIPFATFVLIAGLAGCTSAPLGEATAHNTSVQSVQPVDVDRPKTPVPGGAGGRAGDAVRELRNRSAGVDGGR